MSKHESNHRFGPISDLTEQRIDWLWPGRLALGKPALLEGDRSRVAVVGLSEAIMLGAAVPPGLLFLLVGVVAGQGSGSPPGIVHRQPATSGLHRAQTAD